MQCYKCVSCVRSECGEWITLVHEGEGVQLTTRLPYAAMERATTQKSARLAALSSPPNGVCSCSI